MFTNVLDFQRTSYMYIYTPYIILFICGTFHIQTLKFNLKPKKTAKFNEIYTVWLFKNKTIKREKIFALLLSKVRTVTILSQSKKNEKNH